MAPAAFSLTHLCCIPHTSTHGHIPGAQMQGNQTMKKSWKYGKGTLVYRAVSYTANTSALPLLLHLAERHLSLVKNMALCVPLLPQSPKSLPCRCRQSHTFSFISLSFSFLQQDVRFIPSKSCTTSFHCLPATFHVSWHYHPTRKFKVRQFPGDSLKGNHPLSRYQKEKRKTKPQNRQKTPQQALMLIRVKGKKNQKPALLQFSSKEQLIKEHN